jgi:hypothetical protein
MLRPVLNRQRDIFRRIFALYPVAALTFTLMQLFIIQERDDGRTFQEIADWSTSFLYG